MRFGKHKRGISVVEVLIGVAILSLALVFVGYAISLFVTAANHAAERTKAVYLAQEGMEALRYFRDASWTNISDLTNGTTYYFDISSTTIATTTSPVVIDGTYTQQFVLSELRRDTNGDVVVSGGTVDAGSRYVEVEVTWGTDSILLQSIITNLYDI